MQLEQLKEERELKAARKIKRRKRWLFFYNFLKKLLGGSG